MEFGYFTLSDNHYPNNPRSANQLVLEIREQAILADKIGMHSAWIGEHHFDSLGVNSRPDLLLANIASQTKNIRLAPAVTVLPLHHPVHVAEMWATLDLLSERARRLRHRARLRPQGVRAVRRRLLRLGRDLRGRHRRAAQGLELARQVVAQGQVLRHPGDEHHAPAGAEADSVLRRLVLQDQPGDGGQARPQHHLRAVRGRHGVRRAGQGGRELSRSLRRAPAQKPGRAMCSYFIYIADDARQEDYGRETQMSYFNHCVLQAFPQKKEDAPPTMQYFMKIVDILKNMKKEDLSDKSILLGSPQKIIDTLKKVEASGIDEVILYFNVGNKPHALVKEQMHRFMNEIAPHFKGKHVGRAARAAAA